ncbi:MAG: hypothetical protein V3573_00240 [Desulfovibrionaceae bacterium]
MPMHSDEYADNRPVLRSANGKAFSRMEPVSQESRARGLARNNLLSGWLLYALVLVAGLLFLFGMQGAEKRLGSGPWSGGADSSVKARSL